MIDLTDHLAKDDIAFLEAIKQQLGIVADVSRADVLLYGPVIAGKTRVLAHAHPHSIAPVYLKNYTGYEVSAADMPVVLKALNSRRRKRGGQGVFGDGARVDLEVHPIYYPFNTLQVIGAVSIDTSLIEHERLRRRSYVFRKALRQLQGMLIKAQIQNSQILSPFGEHEGLVVVDIDGYVRYASGIASNLYRRLGVDVLEGLQVENLETHDDQIIRQAMTTLACVEREDHNGGRDWIRKAIPLLFRPTLRANLRHFFRISKLPETLVGTLLVLRDVTEERRQAQALRVKNAMIQEIHHRVKNNLQTIAALLRIQTRRLNDPEGEIALKDATNRILSVAVIHEFLSDADSWTINMKEVSQRIITQLQQGIIAPEANIRFTLAGPSIWLPARQATACALIINELLQNAVEHGVHDQVEGIISIQLTDEGDQVAIAISDNGQGLPDNFNMDTPSSLGLQIVRTLATEDLQGTIDLLTDDDGGTMAKITFPKLLFEEEETGFE